MAVDPTAGTAASNKGGPKPSPWAAIFDAAMPSSLSPRATY